RNAVANPGLSANYALSLWNTSGNGGQGTGIAFSNTANVDNIGGSIIFNRAGANSQGALQFYTKSSTILGDAPDLAFTLNSAGATASISGNTGFAGLVVNNSGNGDLFTASSSGQSRFTINQNGNVGIGTTMPTEKLSVNGNIRIGPQTNSTVAFAKKTQAAGTWSAAGGATTAITQASASAVFNGSLYVGTSKLNSAEVYRYDGGTTWTKVTQPTAGTIASGGTSGIDSITSMTVFNGNLYIGTGEIGSAEIYRYDGGTVWTRINSAAGNVTDVTSVDAISSMIAFEGKLYIGITKTNLANLLVYEGGTSWKKELATNGTVFATHTNTDGITALAGYAGHLYFGTTEPDRACIYQYGGPTTETVAECFAAGQIAQDATTNTDSVTSMTVYNGALYIGTREAAKAQVSIMTGWDL